MSLHDLALVYIQVVREKLVALEIPFVQHTTVRGSPKRQLLVDKYGKFAVPYLEVSMMMLCKHQAVGNSYCSFVYIKLACHHGVTFSESALYQPCVCVCHLSYIV